MNEQACRRGLSAKPAAILTVVALAASGCAHAPQNETSAPVEASAKASAIAAPTAGWAALEVKEPTLLRLKGDPARVEAVKYCALSNAKTYAGPDLRSDKDEATAFTVETRTTKVDASDGRISQTMRTTRKEGTMDLRDFAMPEANEKLDVVLSSQAKVLRAGAFPKGSLYYVPTTSLPDGPVRKGDTWTMQASWSPIGEDARLQLDMLSILQGFWSCGSNRCADVEISGGVMAFAGGVALTGYRNEWRGRMIFDVDAGVVLWSRLESDESFDGERGRRVVRSSLEGAMVSPEALKPPGATLGLCVSAASAASPANPSAPRR